MPHENDLHPQTAFVPEVWRLLEQAGLPKSARVQPLTGGANNRAFRVSHDRNAVVLKLYFHHPDDPRDRCGAEFALSTFAAAMGLDCVPKPVAVDHGQHAAVFEFIDGQPVTADSLTSRHIAAAQSFVTSLNALRTGADATLLPTASEACFKLSDHVERIDSRVTRLSEPMPVADALPELKSVVSAVNERWNSLRANIQASLRRDAGLDELIDDGDRVISPSDFGFHNAIQRPSGDVTFIDFEYAGWDDPAKLVCDFFEQPRVRVPEIYRDDFTGMITRLTANPDWHARRIEVLRPAYSIKWCCILLNEFQPTGQLRRSFSQSANAVNQLLDVQLGQVKQRLAQLAPNQRVF